MADGPYEGGCFCGRVRCRVSGEALRSAVCHCTSCRTATGAQSVAWVSFPYGRFSFIEGEPADFRSSDEVSRTFCQSCGTSLTYRVDEEIREVLRSVEVPSVALVGQRIDTPPSLTSIRESVREALDAVELPSGSVAISVGSRGVAGIGEIVAALVEVLKEAGAEPFVVPAMGSHGASTAEGQADVLAHLGVNEESVGCPVRATMEATRIGEIPSGVEVFMDRNAYEADSVVVVNRVKPHTAFRGTVESGPTKMLAIGLGKQRGAHSIHSAGSEKIHETIPEA